MTVEIENTFQELIGLKLTQTSRSSNMECLKFGIKRNKKNQNIGKFGLHIQTNWRIINRERILVGNNDLYEPNSERQSELDFDYENGNLRDEKLKDILSSEKLIITKILADKIGGLNIEFKNKTELQIFPTNSSESEYNEFWRLIDNRKTESKHLVARMKGIEFE